MPGVITLGYSNVPGFWEDVWAKKKKKKMEGLWERFGTDCLEGKRPGCYPERLQEFVK